MSPPQKLPDRQFAYSMNRAHNTSGLLRPTNVDGHAAVGEHGRCSCIQHLQQLLCKTKDYTETCSTQCRHAEDMHIAAAHLCRQSVHARQHWYALLIPVEYCSKAASPLHAALSHKVRTSSPDRHQGSPQCIRNPGRRRWTHSACGTRWAPRAWR